jgi:hypothetical protein
MGIDMAEALFDFYKDSRFRISVGEEQKPVISTAGSWYKLDPSLNYEKSFHAKDWPNILSERPDLWHLPYFHSSANRQSEDQEVKEEPDGQ